MGNTEIGVGLIIFEQTVVAGLVLLDKVVLKEECIHLGSHNGEAEIVDMPHKHLNLGCMVIIAHKIGAHAALKVFGLSDVDNLTSLVKMLIDTRSFGNRFQLEENVVNILIYALVDQYPNRFSV